MAMGGGGSLDVASAPPLLLFEGKTGGGGGLLVTRGGRGGRSVHTFVLEVLVVGIRLYLPLLTFSMKAEGWWVFLVSRGMFAWQRWLVDDVPQAAFISEGGSRRQNPLCCRGVI